MAGYRFRLRLGDPIAGALLEVLRSRFDHVSAAPGGTVLLVGDLDQAALRALLTLLWDTGHEILSLVCTNGRGA